MALVFFFLFVYITWSRLHCRFLPPICICFVCICVSVRGSQSDREEGEKEHPAFDLRFVPLRGFEFGSSVVQSVYIYIYISVCVGLSHVDSGRSVNRQ